MLRKSKFIFAGLTCLAAIAASPAAALTPLTIVNGGLYSPGTVRVTASNKVSTDYSSIVRFGTIDASGASRDVLGFCVDLFHAINVGIGSQRDMSLDYHTATLVGDSNGNALSTSQIQQIGGLAKLGYSVNSGTAADKFERLAAIQQAIWTIEYPTVGFAAAGGFANQQALAAQYISLAPTLRGGNATIYANDGMTQGFIVAGVPEPGVWAQLILGLGFVGVLARRRRTAIVAA